MVNRLHATSDSYCHCDVICGDDDGYYSLVAIPGSRH